MNFAAKRLCAAWTACLLAAGALCAAGQVIINEVHYDSLDVTNPVEFVELFNTGTTSVGLGGWHFSGGISFAFPSDTVLAAGQYVVVGLSPSAVSNTFHVSSLGPFAGGLGNDADTVRLRNAKGDVQDEVNYQNGFPWPTIGDAPDKSMQLMNPALDNDLGGSWRSGAPTPMSINSVFAGTNSIPPQIRQVAHTPHAPTSTNNVVIAAKVTDTSGVRSVTLSYQVVDPGNYIRLSDAAYPTNWTSIGMNDGGTNGDVLAGDDTYTVAMTNALQVHRRLVRYRVTAVDNRSNSVTVPYVDDVQSNFAYFVYEGIPDWRGADNPGSTPTNTFAGSTMEPFPAYHLIADNTDVQRSQYSNAFADVRFPGTLVYDGTVYDNIAFYNRGEVSMYVAGKNKWRLRFNRGHKFEAKNDYGKKYKAKRDTLNLNACASPWIPVHRGMAGMDEVMSHRLYELAGVLSPEIHWIQFRVIANTNEAPAGDQYGGDLWGLYNVVEHPGGDFLRERGLPSGNIYKLEGAGDKTHQGSTQPTDNSDWVSFNAASANANTVAWWRTNLDLNAFYGFHAINRLVGNVDLREGWNHFLYHNTNDPLCQKRASFT